MEGQEKKGRSAMFWRLDYGLGVDGILVIKAVRMNERAQRWWYLDVKEDLNKGRRGAISKRYSELGAEM